jgi:methionyl-tRNA formyltransferase
VPRLVFAGSSDFALPTLIGLRECGWDLAGVLTQPDRPAGRRRRLAPTPVRVFADAQAIPVQTPESLRTPAALGALAALRPAVLVVVDYGLLLPPKALAVPPAGCINGHASLLPRWRGAAPIQHAILAGDHETGVSVMKMEKGLDTGPVYKMQRVAIGLTETGGELRARLARLCADLILETLPCILAGRLEAVPQEEALATSAPKLDAEAARLDWTRDAASLARQVRAFSPRPGAWTIWRGARLKLHRAVPLSEHDSGAEAGVVWRTDTQGIDVAAGAGSVRVLELQAPGGRVMSAQDFLNSRSLLGERFGV